MEALDWVSASEGFVVSCKAVKVLPLVLLRKRQRAALLELLNGGCRQGGLQLEGLVQRPSGRHQKGFFTSCQPRYAPISSVFFEGVKAVGGALAAAATKHSATSKVLKIDNRYLTGHHLIVIIRRNRSDYVA